MTDSKEKSCWTCASQNISTSTFLGVCVWFEKNKKGENKSIPPAIVDIGCKHWEKK
ncbi:MAG: hypothetical protein WCG78_04315 [Candidatus Omnitrophota bacterium]